MPVLVHQMDAGMNDRNGKVREGMKGKYASYPGSIIDPLKFMVSDRLDIGCGSMYRAGP